VEHQSVVFYEWLLIYFCQCTCLWTDILILTRCGFNQSEQLLKPVVNDHWNWNCHGRKCTGQVTVRFGINALIAKIVVFIIKHDKNTPFQSNLILTEKCAGLLVSKLTDFKTLVRKITTGICHADELSTLHERLLCCVNIAARQKQLQHNGCRYIATASRYCQKSPVEEKDAGWKKKQNVNGLTNEERKRDKLCTTERGIGGRKHEEKDDITERRTWHRVTDATRVAMQY